MAKQYIRTGDYGSIYYYKDPEMTIRHREDGPAIEYVSGNKDWYVNGEFIFRVNSTGVISVRI